MTSGRYWFFYGMHQTDYGHSGRPNDLRPTCFWGYSNGLHPPRSYHPGGVNVLLGDGHVEFIKDSIQQNVWVALGTRAAADF